ncbi:MAG: DNA helicase-4 [Desulforhopalus sp.]|jgi:DNA helicase-4
MEDNSLSSIQKDDKATLLYSSITARPELVTGALWNKIIFQTVDGDSFVVSGLKKKVSESSLVELTQLVGNYHTEQFNPAYQQIAESYQNFKGIFGNRYTRYSKVENWKRGTYELTRKLDNDFVLEFLPEKKRENVSKFLSIFSKSHEIRENQNQKFLSKELQIYNEYFDQVENNPLTERQRLACVANEDNNLVIAGAGSGKTSVIIAKAGYLIQSGLALPHEVLILAYGRKASKETDERIKDKLPNVEGVKTSTFHKLGLDIIGEATGKKPRVSKLQEDTAEFYKLINKILTDLTKSDKAYNQRVIDYFVTHLIPYESEFDHQQQGDYFSALQDGDMRSLKSRMEWAEKRSGKVSLQKEQLKSFEEVVIADFLFVNGIQYIYEHPYEIDTATAEKTQYQPDFYLPEYEIYIEHFGIARDGKTAPFVDQFSYTEGMNWKRKLHSEHETKLVETYSYEMKEGTLTDLLHSKLEKDGVKFSPLSFQELLELLIRIGEEKKADQFNKLIVTFLDLFKQSGYSFEKIRGNADQHPDRPRCHAFIDVFEPIYTEYTNELNQSNTVDFSDMIKKATDLVQSGKYKPTFKYILVDEFQDISAIRVDLVKSLVDKGDDTVLSCVGDDWQSIYRFSGSDISYTGNFEKYFGYTKKVPLDKTFRYNDKLNDFSTTFITQNPAQIKKDVTSHTSVPTNAVTLVEYYKDVDRAIQHSVDVIRTKHPEPATIYILGRYSFSKPDFLQTMAKQSPEYKFLFDTVHGSKGKEADFVIVVDVNDGRYGFPSKIANEPLLDLVLPPSESHDYAEERRLFYVAITRAKHHSFILFDVVKPSVFIEEIRDKKNGSKYLFNQISTEGVGVAPPDFGTCPSCGTGKMMMRVMPNGRFFFGCGHYPFCSYTPRTCNACNKYPLIKDGGSYRCQNSECGNVVAGCKLCSDGVMIERKGKYGTFLGCSNYGKTKCKYTEKILN